MDFNPEEADQPAVKKLLDPGTYTLVVREAEERVSSKGNQMIALELECEDHPGVIIREYLVATQAAMFRIREFTDAAGLRENFDRGRLTEHDCRGKVVRARVMIEEGGEYPDKNRVEEFLAGPAARAEQVVTGQRQTVASAPAGPHSGVDEDDIPF